MSNDDDLNVEGLALPPDVVLTTVTPRRLIKRQDRFVRLPLAVVDVMAKDCRDKAWPLLCYLMYESWRTGHYPVKLANEFLARIGIDRDAKLRALRKLERLGLISIERRGRKSPVIRIGAGGRGHQN
jgi:hypothetical protein